MLVSIEPLRLYWGSKPDWQKGKAAWLYWYEKYSLQRFKAGLCSVMLLLPLPCGCTPTHTCTHTHMETHKHVNMPPGDMVICEWAAVRSQRICGHAGKAPDCLTHISWSLRVPVRPECAPRRGLEDRRLSWEVGSEGTFLPLSSPKVRLWKQAHFLHIIFTMFSLVLAHKHIHTVWRKEMFCARSHTNTHTYQPHTRTHGCDELLYMYRVLEK